MRVARPGESIEQRQEVVTELFNFIRDFFGLDTTSLVMKTLDDQKFLEAAEAVLQSAVGPWKSVDALRDFAVQMLYGEKPADKSLADRTRGRVSPFSVPFQLLRALAPNGQFNPRELRTLSVAETLDCNGYAGEEQRWETRPHSGEVWLVTTMWARVIPRVDKSTKIRVYNIGENCILHEGRLWALAADAMPCFWWFPGYTPIEVTLTRQQETEPTTVMIAIEGWRYPVR